MSGRKGEWIPEPVVMATLPPGVVASEELLDLIERVYQLKRGELSELEVFALMRPASGTVH